MKETNIIPVEAAARAKSAMELSGVYDEFEIVCADAYTGAAAELKKIKAAHKELTAVRRSLTKPLDESKSKIMDLFRVPLDKLKSAEGNVNTAMVSWAQEQEKIRQAEQERLRKAQQAEATRLARHAAKAAERGDTKKAAEFDNRSEEVSFAAPATVPSTTKVKGLAMVDTWKFRIIDLAKLPREYMIANEVMLGKMARMSKGLIPVPGVEFYSEGSVRGTR